MPVGKDYHVSDLVIITSSYTPLSESEFILYALPHRNSCDHSSSLTMVLYYRLLCFICQGLGFGIMLDCIALAPFSGETIFLATPLTNPPSVLLTISVTFGAD